MPKPLKILLATLGTLLLLLVAVILAGFGLLSSEPGTAFLARQVQHNLGQDVHWQRLEGSITSPLALWGVSFRQPGLSLQAEQIELRWNPVELLRGRLELTRFHATGLAVTLTPQAGEEEPAAAFDPATVRLPVDVFLSDVQVTGLDINQEGQTRRIDHIQLAGNLSGDQVTVERLQIRAPEGELSLAGGTRLTRTMPLDLNTSWTFLDAEGAALSGESALAGTLTFSNGIDFDLNYSVTASGLQSLQPELPASVDAAGSLSGRYLDDRIDLNRFSLAQGDDGLDLVLRGAVSELSTATPGIAAELAWQRLRWPLDGEAAELESAEGAMSLSGSPEDYALEMQLALAGSAVPPGSWHLTGTGSTAQLQVDSLRGQLLEGQLDLSGLVAWDPLPSWQLQLQARDLNPQYLVAELPGQLAARLSTRGEIGAGDEVWAQLDIQQIHGELAGYPLSITGAGQVHGDQVQLASIQLDSGRNRLSASGLVSEKALDLDWQLRALAPGDLLAGARGRISGQGTLSGSSESPVISARLRGEELQLDTLQSASLTLDLAAGLQATDPLELKLATGPVIESGNTLLQSLAVKAKGTTAKHRIELGLDTGSEQLAAGLKGGVAPSLDAWRGMLAELTASTSAYGAWRLKQQSELQLAATAARLGNSCLGNTEGQGRVCIGGDWSADSASAFSLAIEALPVSLVQPAVSGEINGNIEGQLAADGAIAASGVVALGAGTIDIGEGQKPLQHGGGKLDVQVGEQGLASQLAFAAPQNGELTAHVQMPALNALPLADEQPISGSIRASLPDLSGAAAWITELDATGGAVDVDMQLGGSLANPRVLGKLSLDNGSADIPMAGLQLRQVELQAASTSARPDSLEISGSLRSGKGSMTLSGGFDMATSRLQLALSGNNFQAYNTADARVLLAPDLQIGWQQDTLTLRGEVLVPQADITPTLALNPAVAAEDGEQPVNTGQAIAPSQDVVIVKGEVQGLEELEMTAPFRIDNQVRLRLGDAVNINAIGFMGRLTGDVLFSNTVEQVDLVPIANGKFSVEDGTFRSFGQDLDIRTGELLFNNRPATEPEINLRAVRWIDNDPQVTSAGILLTGPITTPTMELFSRPQLETSEVQSYLITGRSTRDRNSVLSIGTYVTPRIYVGYGYNTLEKTSEFNSLFTITPRYGVGLNAGEADSNLNMTVTYEH